MKIVLDGHKGGALDKAHNRIKEGPGPAPDLPYADLLPEGDVPDLLPELARQVLS